jgi:hypothetical protein
VLAVARARVGASLGRCGGAVGTSPARVASCSGVAGAVGGSDAAFWRAGRVTASSIVGGLVRPNGEGIVPNGLGVLAVLALFVDCDGSRFDGGLPLPFDGATLGSFEPNAGIFEPVGGGELGLATRGIGLGGSNVPVLVGATGNGDGSSVVFGGGVVRGAFGGGSGDFGGSEGRAARCGGGCVGGDLLVAVGVEGGDFVVDVGRGCDAGGLLNAVGASCSSGSSYRGAASLVAAYAIDASSFFGRANAVGTSLSDGARAAAICAADAANVGGSAG